jgi:hypothetical protein
LFVVGADFEAPAAVENKQPMTMLKGSLRLVQPSQLAMTLLSTARSERSA